MKKTFIASIFALTALGAVAHAEESTSCDVAKDKWMAEDALKAKLTGEGMEVRKIKVENGCYEVYGIDAKGGKVEALYNPETGEQAGTAGAD
ncbi:PepSY domain-containing protein [Ciceribacter ferrooxidans]|uniref:PepSY domain-containing protein n=1 Tax=Ciceribacter ferrooxidans TaxID=2509717 RepID=A0A4Q2T1L0_9HYPH|nr:PepSY domain-containing protein [Ciceribacter ferrooxidans]RYC11791.1 PepSY domain-containing protein [Ciceribacter ferrooxidans]